ncbi:MAG: hypothetical protein QHI48_00655 [Bacteroidota bacterium]|nr:hypothetical protein [Bacteroidota bacterium]
MTRSFSFLFFFILSIGAHWAKAQRTESKDLELIHSDEIGYTMIESPSIMVVGEPDLLTEAEKQAFIQEGDFLRSGNTFRIYIIFTDPVRIRPLPLHPTRDASYSFNVPPRSKLVCIQNVTKGEVLVKGVRNDSDGWIKITGRFIKGAFIFMGNLKDSYALFRP